MCGPVAIPIATAAIGLAQQAMSSSGAAKTYDANAKVADQKSTDTIVTGNQSYVTQKNKTSTILGGQRAAMGASGIQVDTGSSGDVLAQTATTGELDAQTIRSNALKQAWGYQVEAANDRAAARNSRNTAKMIDPLGFIS